MSRNAENGLLIFVCNIYEIFVMQMLDGGYGINHEYIDGIPADTVCAVVEVLRCLAVICHDNSNRGF